MSGSQEALPKGLSIETLRLVREALTTCDGDLSATELGEQLNLSRGSARRYLEYLVNVDEAQVRLKYGGVGRPERRYAARP
jgi:response regulator of citrate/malate metabolism